MQARKVSEEQKKEFISPYNDMDVVKGQGSIAVELL
jgi:threonine dehydratase